MIEASLMFAEYLGGVLRFLVLLCAAACLGGGGTGASMAKARVPAIKDRPWLIVWGRGQHAVPATSVILGNARPQRKCWGRDRGILSAAGKAGRLYLIAIVDFILFAPTHCRTGDSSVKTHMESSVEDHNSRRGGYCAHTRHVQFSWSMQVQNHEHSGRGCAPETQAQRLPYSSKSSRSIPRFDRQLPVAISLLNNNLPMEWRSDDE